MLFVYIIVGLLVCFFVFMAIVSFIIFRMAFSRADKYEPICEADIANTHYAPYEKELRESYDKITKYKYDLEKIISDDGYTLYGYYFNNNSDKTCIMVHGYEAHPFNNYCIGGVDFFERGYNIFLIVNRAHFISEGKYITFGEYEHKDLLKWIDYINQKYSPKDLVVYGTSMGCNIVARSIDKLCDNVKACILDCGYIYLPDELKFILKNKKIRPTSIISWFMLVYIRIFIGFNPWKSDTRENLANAKVPAFFIHGKQDILVDFNDGVKSFEACSTRKDSYFSDVADHATGYFAGKEFVKNKVFDFIDNK